MSNVQRFLDHRRQLSVELLWLLHGVLFHGIPNVMAPKHILRKRRVLLLLLPLLLL